MNLLVSEGTQVPALLALEDGTCFCGRACGAMVSVRSSVWA